MRTHIFHKTGSFLCCLGLSAGIILMCLGFYISSADTFAFPEKPSARLGKGTVGQIAYSPDGELLAVAGSIGTWLYDADNLNEVGLLQGHTGKVSSVAFSPDGKTLASGGRWPDNTIRLWDVASQKQTGLLLGHTDMVRSVAFSPDRKTLASGGWDDNIVRLWDVVSQKQAGLLKGHTSGVESVAFSPDGKTLASGSTDNTVLLWDVAYQMGTCLLQGHTDSVSSVAFSPDGRWLASGSGDGTILLWEVNLQVLSKVEPGGKQLVTWGDVKRTGLYQNFPNPFNPETWIPFSLSEPERMKIRIYSSNGQLIRTLDLGQKPAGEYLSKEESARWDGRDENGEAAASGVYFYVMEAGEFRDSRKMVVVR